VRPSEATKCPWGTGKVHALIWGGTAFRDLLSKRSVNLASSKLLGTTGLVPLNVSPVESERDTNR
jgi:hypothetical protein